MNCRDVILQRGFACGVGVLVGNASDIRQSRLNCTGEMMRANDSASHDREPDACIGHRLYFLPCMSDLLNDVELIVPNNDRCGEGPVWDWRRNVLVWTDIGGR